MIQWAAAAGAILGVMGLLRSEYEKEQLSVEYVDVESGKLTRDRTFVFLSDLHSKEFGPDNRRLVQVIDQVRPDWVFLGGDMTMSQGPRGSVTKAWKNFGRAEDDRVIRLVRKLAVHYPVYAANGNHEERMSWESEAYGKRYEWYWSQMERAGAVHLANTSVELEGNVTLSGLRLGREYYRKLFLKRPFPMPKRFLNKSLGQPDRERFQILMAHSPLYFQEYARWGADLSLAGHFHGGTIRFPLLGGVMTPQYQFFCPYCAGQFWQGEKCMMVSRGLGTHSVNVRICNLPQVLVVKLKKKDD